MRLSAICLLALLAAAMTTARADRLIGEGDPWRYYKGTTFPPAQAGVDWTKPAFDDSGWGVPAASGFGYGDGDDTTVLADMQNNYVSVYLRRTFTGVDPVTISHLTLAVDYDDGFVAYLNGAEIARRNMPAGLIGNTTSASGNHEASRGTAAGQPQEKEFITIDKSLLSAGANVLAIEGHNVSLTSSDFSLIPELYDGVNLLRGPYVEMPQAGAMTIVWRTDAATDSAVDYGTDASYSSGTITDATLVRDHEISLPNLLPNTDYLYRIRSGGVMLSAGNVLRSARSADQPFRFSVIGDFGYAAMNTTDIANRVAESNCDLLMTVGDNIYDPVGGEGTGQPGVYDKYWFTPYAATMRRVPTFPALGNHDIETANGAWYLSYFRLPPNGPAGSEIERNYSFDYGNAHFVVIDANAFVNPFDSTRTAAIKSWLTSDLAATQQRWKFVFFHQPAYTSSGNNTHDPATQLQADIQPICAQYGVQMVFQGHNHFYERINPISGVNYIVTGSGGRELTSPNVFPTYSAVVNHSVYSFVQVDLVGAKLTLRQIDAAGNQIDSFVLDLDHPFKIDGLLDSPAYLRAANPNGLKLYAAIRGNFLYLATQDAGEGSDHFIYLNNQSAALRAANWAKTGQIMTWSAFLADENETGFKGWFNSSEQLLSDSAHYTATTSGLNNNGAAGNGVLEGTIDLRAHFGAFPAQLYLAAAPFASADRGALVSGAQVPPGNGDGNLQANEFLALNTRDIALDLPQSNAGADQIIEAGMQVILAGSGSAPSGLALSFAWSQLTGPAATINHSNEVAADFTATSNVAQPTVLTFQLRVNDARFDTDDAVSIQLNPMLDSDGDGLSDQEEITGRDNSLTTANPAGSLSDPHVADTDGDGANDGNEALAGTNPNDARSLFRITNVVNSGSTLVVTWASLAGKTYRVQARLNFPDEWRDVGLPVPGMAGFTSSAIPITGDGSSYRIRLVQ